jgi:hypothetical protein
MKNLLILFVVLVGFSSCAKKYNYQCTNYGKGGGFAVGTQTIEKTMTENQMSRFVKKNTDNDKIMVCTVK